MRPLLLLSLLLLTLSCRTGKEATPTTMGRAAEVMTDGETVYQRFRPDSVQRPVTFEFSSLRGADYADYLPDTINPALLPERRVRLNFHVMNSADTLYDMTGAKALEYSQSVLNYTNAALRDNKVNWLNPGPEPPPVYTSRLTWVLPDDPTTGEPAVYEHFDDELYGYIHNGREKNRADRAVMKKYDVRPKEELNIYWMGPPKEMVKSMGRKSDSGSGIYLGSAIKVTDVLSREVAPWAIRKVFEHELGHALGLYHAWTSSDGCDDTPTHKNNAWKLKKRGPGLSSNNLMDYSPDQKALTPCQIGRMHFIVADLTKRQRGWVIPDWCDYRPAEPIEITRTITLNGARDYGSDLVVKPGASLTINNRISLPDGAAIKVEAGGRLILGPAAVIHNDCGGQWRGIWLADEVGGRAAVATVDPAATLLNVAP